MTKRVKISIDGHPHEVEAGANLLQAALGEGKNLPYFCWHPALGSVGACRQCAVIQYKDEHDDRGRLVMACMTPCTDEARFSIEAAEATEMREAVVEFLMTNHPHDCPVCEEGGHCHLQDMTVMTGHGARKYRHTKRTHRNQDLGPFVSHEMNRCIACYRCVRYYRDYAGGRDLDVFGTGADVYFGRAADGTLESPFAGNLVEVCPTGVFTDRPYGESYTRKWDLQSAPSVCTHCAIGCNTSPGERYGRLKRVENRYHGEVNGYFLCDRGRYGSGFVNREDRPRRALRRAAGTETALDPAAAVETLRTLLDRGEVIGIGSPRASLEANHALRQLVGADHFYQGQSAADATLDALAVEILRSGPARIGTVRDAESADAVLVLGEDVMSTGPRLALALRQSVRQAGFKDADRAHIPRWQDASVRTLAQDRRSPLFVATPAPTGLDDLAAATFRAAPGRIAQFGQAVAHALDAGAPKAEGLDEGTEALAGRVADALAEADRPLIVSGTGLGSADLLQASANITRALAGRGSAPALDLVFSECNAVGAALLGGAPLETAFTRLTDGRAKTMIVLENDLFRRAPTADVEAALSSAGDVVVLDAVDTPTMRSATLVLPAGSFAESDGTFVNFEGRAQRGFQVMAARDSDAVESWRWLQRAAGDNALGICLDDLTRGCGDAEPALARIRDAAPGATFRLGGARIPRQSHRYSGRTAMDAKADVHEPRPPQDPDSPLAFSMEGATGLADRPAPLIPMFWSPGWNSPQAVNKFQQEIAGPLRGGDPGVRLFAADADARHDWRPVRTAKGGILEAVALHEVFGSEELSAMTPVMAAQIPQPYVALAPATAKRLNVRDGARVRVSAESTTATLDARIVDGLAEGLAGLPQGLEGVPRVSAGSPATIEHIS